MKKPDKLIPLFKVFMSASVMNPLEKTLMSGYIGQGPRVEEFEKKIASFIGNPYVLTVNSGTSALHLALRLIGIKPGDEVITTPMTCTATNWPILSSGGTIVWADIDPASGNINPKSIASRITKKTKAIMAVDWGGYPVDIAAIKKASGGIPVIEDAAHAFGTVYNNKIAGQSADYTCFSFQAIKHLTCGDGGALVVQNKKTYQRGKLLRWYGIDRERRSQHERIEIDVHEWGYKFHMNDINATIGLANFKQIRSILKKHRDNASYYKKTLTGLDNVTLLTEHTGNLSSYWLFTIRVKHVHAFIAYMNECNVMVSQVHRRNDTHPVTAAFTRRLPGVDEFASEMVCIPVGWWVTKSERRYISECIGKYDKIAQTLPNKKYAKSVYCPYCG